MGVLVGVKLVQAGASPQEASPSVKNEPKNGGKDQAGAKARRSAYTIISRSQQSEAESPFQTAWIQISGDRVKVQWLQDAIVPRNSDFWRLGENTDSVRTSRGTIQEDFL